MADANPQLRGHPDGRTRARWERYDTAYEAAIELFVERGYDDTTMDAIAEQAGSSRASVFNYFPRKTAILTEWSRRRRTVVSAMVDAQPLPVPFGLRDELLRYFAAWATVNERTRTETVACAPPSLRETSVLTDSGMSREIARMLADARQRGELVTGLDVDLAAHALAAAYFAVGTMWIERPPSPGALARDLAAVAELFLGGLLAETRRPVSPRQN